MLCSYQPLEFGSWETRYGGTTTTTSAGEEQEHKWRWHKGGRFATGQYLENQGPRAVRVTAITVPGPQDFHVPWDNWQVGLTDDPQTRTVRAFEPFTLQPGEDKEIWFTGDFDACPKHYATGSFVSISDADVTFEVLGVKRRHYVPLSLTYGVAVERACR